MLAFMRKFAKSWLAAVLFVPLLVVFAMTAVNRDTFSIAPSTYVIKVGSRTVTQQDFRREFEKYKAQLEQRYQQPISMEVVQEQGVDRNLLEELAFKESLDELLTRMGLRASDAMLKKVVRQEPRFFDSVTGNFDEKKFVAVLAENKLTPPMFDQIVSDEMRRSQFVSAAVAGLRAPRAYSAIGGLFALEQRDLAYFTVSPASVGAVAQPTDAEIDAFIKANVPNLPEFRSFTVVRFNTKAYESQMTVTEVEVQKQFDFMKDSLSKPELRSVVQIPAKDAAQAATIIARLNKGEDPAVVARAFGVAAVTYADKPRSSFFDKTIAAAAFALPKGAVSGPLKGEFGLAVVKVTSITPGTTATLAAHRAEIEAKIRGDLAGAKLSDVSKVYEDAHEAGATLVEAAGKAGVPTAVYGPVTADGRGRDGKPIAGIAPAILKAAFELAQGGESDIQEVGEGEYFAVRVDGIIAPARPPIAAIRPAVIQNMIRVRQADAMKARAEVLAARINKGESLSAVAASAGATIVRVDAISRATLQAHQALGRDLVGGALGAKKGQAFTAAAPNFSVAVAVITAIRPGDPVQVAQATEQGQPQFTQEIFSDIGQAARAYARTRLKAKADLARARVAIGIEATTAANGTPAGKGK